MLSQTHHYFLKDYFQRLQIIAGIINFQMQNKKRLLPLTLPTFTKKKVVFFANIIRFQIQNL